MSRIVHGCNPCDPNACGNASLDELLSGAKLGSEPAKLDLSHLVFKVRDQGEAGTCVGFGVTQAAVNCVRQCGFPAFEDMSSLGAYIQALALERRLKALVDGTSIDVCLRALGKGGYLFEKEFPYKPELRHKGFKLGKGQTALRRCGIQSHRIYDGTEAGVKSKVKSLLAAGAGIVGGWVVGEAFELWTPDQGPWDGNPGAGACGHCMCIQDFPEGDPRIINSWGDQVGDKGFWTFSWKAVAKASSPWAITFVP